RPHPRRLEDSRADPNGRFLPGGRGAMGTARGPGALSRSRRKKEPPADTGGAVEGERRVVQDWTRLWRRRAGLALALLSASGVSGRRRASADWKANGQV